MTRTRVNHRARTRADREGDPLDGMVNLFDLGIVLAVGFLLAALSSAKLTPKVLDEAAKPVVAKRHQRSAPIELEPGERVIGRGRPLGTVYRLEDGRTVIVRRAGVRAP